MKSIIKKTSKLLSLILIITISFIGFTACSNKTTASIQAPETPGITSENITNEPIADKVTDSDKNNSTDSDTSTDSDKIQKPSNINIADKIPGVFKFSDENLSYDDIYYDDENELLNFFKTSDINGVYDTIERLNFEHFTKNLTKYTIKTKTNNIAIAISSAYESEHEMFVLHYDEYNTYAEIINSNYNIILKIENNIITTPENSLNIEYDIETDSLTVYFQFYYVDETTNKTIYTPLYVKSKLLRDPNFDNIIEDIDYSKYYIYKKHSAKLTNDESFANSSKLAEMFMVEDIEAVYDLISSWTLIFNNDMSKLIISSDINNSLTITEKSKSSTCFLIYNSFYINVIKEEVDLTTGINTLYLEIVVDDLSTFTFNFNTTSNFIF